MLAELGPAQAAEVALGLIGAGAVVAGVGAIVWLAGSSVNPAADARYVQSLPEDVLLFGVGGVTP